MSRFAPNSAAFRIASRFTRREDGGLIIFSLFIIVCMLLCTGVAIDTLRYEVQRTKIQNTADRAVLAAASLNQDHDPQEVVEDYFQRMGLPADAIAVDVTPTVGGKTVSAATTVAMPSLFMRMVGVDQLTGPALGQAQETVTDVEVVLVLDNSGSMGWSGNYRLDVLKGAAKQFIDDVVRDETGQGTVAVSIVPFATQVNAGPALTGFFDVSDEHAYSHCVTFGEDDFDSAEIGTGTPLQRTGHVDINYYATPPRNEGLICPQDASREITLWSSDRTLLKDKIDDMWAGGNTSIDLGARWGLALLDPSARPLLAGRIADGTSEAELAGMPFDYDRPNTKKYLVVMSDGQNTDQFDLNPEFRTGASPVWRNGDGDLSYFHEGNGQYYHLDNGTWNAAPDGGNDAVNLTWPCLLYTSDAADELT